MEGSVKQIKGIRISRFIIWMMVLAIAVYGGMVYMTVHTMSNYHTLIQCVNAYLTGERSVHEISDASDYLTEQVRLYTVGCEAQYMDAYFTEANVIRRREKALARLEAFGISRDSKEVLDQALASSNQLMEWDRYAMRLVAAATGVGESRLPPEVAAVKLSQEDALASDSAKLEKARELVFGNTYTDQKREVNAHLDAAISKVQGELRGSQHDSVDMMRSSLVHQKILLAIMLVINGVIFAAIAVLILRPLKVYVENMRLNKPVTMIGSYEFKYLAFTYNGLCEINSKNESMLRHRAEHDPLTDTMNRRAFARIKQTLNDVSLPIALMIIDVDYFKNVNDKFGHKTGDAILKKVADSLKESFYDTDYVIRMGGDEFIAILTNVTEEHKDILEEKMHKINYMLQHPVDGLPSVSLSIGVAFSAGGYQEEMYNQADQALYCAKEAGRACHRFYDDIEPG